jgi:predicted nucleic acid-binding Zn ribbon protein
MEADQSIKDDPLEECPKCLTCALKRVITGGQGFVLKGGGWYTDGYASTPDSDE